MPSEIASPAELMHSFTDFFRRQYPTILFIALVTTALGVLYLLTTRPMYTAHASMIIDTRKLQIFQRQAVVGDNTVDEGMVDSQVQILKSETISAAVIKLFHLTKDPELVGGSGSLFGTVIGWFTGLFAASTPESDYELSRRAAEAFASRLSVKRIGLSYIIDIGFQSHDPQHAADIANAVADAYITDQLNAKYDATRRAGTWLQDRLRDLRDQAATAQRAVVQFKTKNNIVSTGGSDRPLVDQQQVSELNSQLVIARTQLGETRARLDRIQTVLRADTPDATLDATVTDTLKDDVITKLRSHYLELAQREADWAGKYGNTHLAVVNLRNQMREIKNSILDELRRIGESYKSDYDIAKQREAELEKQLAQAVGVSQVTNQAQVELDTLESNAKSYRALYDDFLQRYMESVQQQSFPITEARVVTAATRPLNKSSPKTFLVLLVTGLGGILLGTGIGRLRDLSDRVFRTRGQVESFLGLDCVAIVPWLKTDTAKDAAAGAKKDNTAGADIKSPSSSVGARFAGQAEQLLKSLAQGAVGGPTGVHTVASEHDLYRQVVDAPLSPFVESIRSIKMAVDLNGAGKSNKVIGITSTFPGEGKSTISASLSQLMAHSGGRVLLVDCDLRAPNLTRRLAKSPKVGLLEVASGKASIEEAVLVDRSTKMNFLPMVAKSRLLHTAEILASDELKACLDNLRESYDYIVVDFSPLFPIVDVRATKALVDSYIFIAEWGRTKIEAVQRALKEVPGVYDNILGVVLNKADTNSIGRYEGYAYHYQSKYYSRYGYNA
jgi:polysaccharide biosynthesis transport protein